MSVQIGLYTSRGFLLYIDLAWGTLDKYICRFALLISRLFLNKLSQIFTHLADSDGINAKLISMALLRRQNLHSIAARSREILASQKRPSRLFCYRITHCWSISGLFGFYCVLLTWDMVCIEFEFTASCLYSDRFAFILLFLWFEFDIYSIWYIIWIYGLFCWFYMVWICDILCSNLAFISRKSPD